MSLHYHHFVIDNAKVYQIVIIDICYFYIINKCSNHEAIYIYSFQ